MVVMEVNCILCCLKAELREYRMIKKNTKFVILFFGKVKKFRCTRFSRIYRISELKLINIITFIIVVGLLYIISLYNFI